MKVTCIDNNSQNLGEELAQFAFTQDKKTGKVDLTIGQEYIVYGIRQNNMGIFYLVLTDTINNRLPWWMPAVFYHVSDATKPTDWVCKTFENEDIYTINPEYFEASEDIEDGTPKGYEAFAKIKESDYVKSSS